ncbi:hypothetical protein NX794_00930 [Streptomyces sp. LP11]|uniref:Integrase n=1 Tax=Streptomyces pyxinicus TaxID=2970331 RepID=A0ABT2AU81_9ACTN|nr:hypothetical protein [Streptomyces sp. LP11]MCS0599809.1 hypothetical protein [Streptomyces sp. LP11]
MAVFLTPEKIFGFPLPAGYTESQLRRIPLEGVLRFCGLLLNSLAAPHTSARSVDRVLADRLFTEPVRSRVLNLLKDKARRLLVPQACILLARMAAQTSPDTLSEDISEAAQAGLSPSLATMKLAEYGEANMDLAPRGLELKTLDPYLAGWRMRVVPALGHLAVRMITNGVVDRAVQNWIVDEHSRSTVKNTIAVLVRVMEQAVRDGVIKVTPARVSGRQKLYGQAEDELRDPGALALPGWNTLVQLADALVAASYNQYGGRGDVRLFAASTAARIGDVSGCRVADIDTNQWIWTVRRQTTPARPRRTHRQGHQGQASPESAHHRGDPPARASASSPPAQPPTRLCSPAHAQDASPPRSCATPPTGTRWSPASATSTCAATISATPH